jgi:cellobionic acid phosphorylase
MGMVYIKPAAARSAFVRALSQQASNGAMPDGVLLHDEAQLKYINQVPHVDHAVWLPLCLRAYLDETGDYEFLAETLPFACTEGQAETASVFEHIERALRYLMGARDGRGLHYIEQGDWCDPMNMVGYQGKGVSAWLSLASAYAMKQWAEVCEQMGEIDLALQHNLNTKTLNEAVNQHCWDGQWYGRGISDGGIAFGVSEDCEGKIYLNPQSWSLLSGAANSERIHRIKQSVSEQLFSPYGVMMLAPSYTHMHEHIGRLTQKFPGSAENGSVYNHAAIFYVYSLFECGDADAAFGLMRKMLPSRDAADYLRRGQMPNFIPNYYRGAYHQFPEVAGQSSHLFNTGTVAWFYRALIDGLLGLRGCGSGITIKPLLPAHWPKLRVERRFRGAQLDIECARELGRSQQESWLDGEVLEENMIKNIEAGRTYTVKVLLPEMNSLEAC